MTIIFRIFSFSASPIGRWSVARADINDKLLRITLSRKRQCAFFAEMAKSMIAVLFEVVMTRPRRRRSQPDHLITIMDPPALKGNSRNGLEGRYAWHLRNGLTAT
ncbi:hypothetical protein [Rhizobium ruizarguesonis]|uniref:hypothetical protein n=1 Tax=Rhizobium ruizarguesonis TaxID=2081791 RepID=UPI001030F0D7|nr:hypothetical protein [Rhizobium ruizarguesonis]TAZ56697.1 hypothetical protein ELH71_09900 [Rhizobium ruizarguesonis]